MELAIVAENDLMEILGANKATMYRLRNRGPPYISIDKRHRIYLVEDLMKFFETVRTQNSIDER